ncbi:MAG TPA: hypothetical protein VF215_03705, partial [Thermoanaerobaculia bacterium]
MTKRSLAVLLVAFSLSAQQPRAINDAEREGVAIVASFLARGPVALWERLSPDAPLRALSRDDAMAELAVRAGPTSGVQWTLQTVSGGRPGDVAFRVRYASGYEDGLLLRLAKHGDRWSLRELLTLAEDPRDRVTPPAPAPPKRLPIHALLIGAAIALLVLSALIFRKSRVLATIGVLAAIAGIAIALSTPRRAPTQHELPFVELRALTPLREALARGDDATLPKGLAPATRDVAMLWLLQSGATIHVPGTPGDPLGGLATAKDTPLAEIVRARIALTKGRTADAVAAYQRALAIEPHRDDLTYEALPHVADANLNGSRDPRIYYARADLRTAWSLAPVSREELLRDSHFAPLLRDVRTMSMVSLYATEEPVPRSPQLGQTPIALPPNAQSFVNGGFLGIEIGGASLNVPGGAALASRNAHAVPATHWKQQEDAAALRDAATLLELPARSRGQTRVESAAEALADHNRWRELIALTDDITPNTPTVPPRLLVLRMRALLRADRTADARALAEGAAVQELIDRASYPGTLLAIGDAIASSDHQSWDTTEHLYRAVTADEQKDVVAARLRQLQLRRALATNGITIATPHFDIRHDPTMNPAIASRIGDLLEAERTRVLQRLPAAQRDNPRRVTVNVFYWDDFRGSITGTDHILGLYDGEILFPFGVVNQFKPEIVAIITHELTHAIVAQATGDNAPRWFQEGIAQRMELVAQHANVFHDTKPEFVLPVPLLDAAMENAGDLDMIEQGYRVSQTFIRFL